MSRILSSLHGGSLEITLPQWTERGKEGTKGTGGERIIKSIGRGSKFTVTNLSKALIWSKVSILGLNPPCRQKI